MISAPTGTVTLVFTDIEGSTALWEQFGPEFQGTLDIHNQVVRSCIVRHHGYEVKTEGDAFMIAFSDPMSAVSFCLEAQIGLHDADWPDELLNEREGKTDSTEHTNPEFHGLLVRMGVHSGTPTEKVDPNTGTTDYFGSMVNRAARIASAGHGGQVLISSAVWGVVRDSLNEAAVSDLGDHALKGLERREHIYQVSPKTLADRRFPKLKTPDLAKSNLPTRLSSFVGRNEELNQLAAHFSESETRLVTLIGIGGTGKTRLAQRFAGQYLADFLGGVWFCDLTEARSLEGLLSVVSDALETPMDNAKPINHLGNELKRRGRVLLVLDNLEQVVDHAGETVGAWLQQTSETHFLVTSRIALNLEGETPLFLDPLPTPIAVQLFEDRARGVKPSFKVTDTNRAVIEEIVERLDGLSLAIELAAARVKILTPEKLLERLSQRFQLLTGGRRDQQSRQATLRGAIDWSWELLKPWEQAALAQCSVFRGGFNLDAAEAVLDLSSWEDAPMVIDVIQSLVDQSLLRSLEPIPGFDRFGLYESIEQYAAEKLAKWGVNCELERRAADAHAQYFTTLATDEGLIQQLTSDGVFRRSMDLEIENFLAAINQNLKNDNANEAAAAYRGAARIFTDRGQISTAQEWVQKILSSDDLDLLPRVKLMRSLAWFQTSMNKLTASTSTYESALELAIENGYLEEEAYLQGMFAETKVRTGHSDTALRMVQRSVQIMKEIGDSFGLAQANRALGDRQFDEGQYGDAKISYKASLKSSREHGYKIAEADALGRLSDVAWHRGDLQLAKKCSLESLAIVQEMGQRSHEAYIERQMGYYLQCEGRYEEAQSLIERSLVSTRQYSTHVVEAWGHLELCELFWVTGDVESGFDHLNQARELDAEQESLVYGGVIGCLEGALQIEAGNMEQGQSIMVEAIAQLSEIVPKDTVNYRSYLALSYSHTGKQELARELMELIYPLLPKCEKYVKALVTVREGMIANHKGQNIEAAKLLHEAESIAKQIGVGPNSELMMHCQSLAQYLTISSESSTD